MSAKENELLGETLGNEEKPVKVMLAEDDGDDQELFREALEQSGASAELKVFDNGEQLVEHLKDPQQENPDIIFLDLNMPLKDGRETLREIKEDDVLKEIPTVVLSTSDSMKDVKATFEAGASTYIEKPNSFKGFVVLLKKVFSFHWAGMLLRPLWERFFLSEKNIHRKY